VQIRIALLAMLLGSLSASVWGADPSPEPPADITCRLDSGTASLSAEGGPQGALLKLATPSFAGTATFTFKGGSTSARLKFRFANTRMMQSFTLSDGKRSYQGSLGWGSNKTVASWDKSGRSAPNPAVAAVTMVMELTKAGDIEVTVSTARDMELGKEIRVSWQQDYRKARADRLLGTK
jgi:hypothetical protein